jgi:hypothetical protein
MAGTGTGYPNWFLCPVERRELNDRHYGFRASVSVHNKRRTGRTKPAPSPGKGHPRKLFTSHEYICSCGHRGWTCHSGILDHPPADRS